MLLTATYLGAMLFQPYYYQYPSREPTIFDIAGFFINRFDILFFIVTITTSTLATTGFGKKDQMYKISIYLFTVSMILLFLSILKWLFTFPWVS
jgi:hypothetical protein